MPDTEQSVTKKKACAERHMLSFFISLLFSSTLILTGCSTSGRINAARENFYLGRTQKAIENLRNASRDNNASILELMERGMAFQLASNYNESAKDFVAAAALANELDYYSITKGTASMVINDRVLNYSGAPYERTLLHSFAAKNFLAMSMWDDAAVEARNIADRLANLEGFPDDPYSHYLAGFCFEMISDNNSSRIEYRAASQLLSNIKIDEITGKIIPATTNKIPEGKYPDMEGELICFIGIGRGPTEYGSWNQKPCFGTTPYVEVYINNLYVGRSYIFTTTHDLMVKTQRKIAAMKTVKTVSRIAIKETIANEISEKNALLGELVRFLLLSLETTDVKRWETLPHWLEIARVPCPVDIKEYTLVLKGQNDVKISEIIVKKPLTHRWKIYFSLVRFL